MWPERQHRNYHQEIQMPETPRTAPRKAVVAFVLTFLTALLAQVADKTTFSDLTVLQWLIAVVSAVVTAGAVYGTSNPPA